MKIKQIRCHIGVSVGYRVLTGVNAEKDKVTLTRSPEGCSIFVENETHYSEIPYSNIHEILYETKEEAKIVKRGP